MSTANKLINRYAVDCLVKVGWGVDDRRIYVFAYDSKEAEVVAKMRLQHENKRYQVFVENVELEDENGI